MQKVKYYPSVECPGCKRVMWADRDAHIIKCVDRNCENHGRTFHAPTVELVPVDLYGLWSERVGLWLATSPGGLVCSANLSLMQATSELANKWQSMQDGCVTDWQVKIFSSGIPVDLPRD